MLDDEAEERASDPLRLFDQSTASGMHWVTIWTGVPGLIPAGGRLEMRFMQDGTVWSDYFGDTRPKWVVQDDTYLVVDGTSIWRDCPYYIFFRDFGLVKEG